MIDIKLLRTTEGINLIKESEKSRYRSTENIIKAKELDEEIIKLEYNINEISRKLNLINDSIKEFYKSKSIEKKLLNNFLLEKSKYETFKNKDVSKLDELKKEFNNYFSKIGNLLDKRVVISNTEDDNLIIEEFKAENPIYKQLEFELLSHDVIMNKLNGLDMKRGTKIVGHRGFFLKNDVALLENALARYAIDFLLKKNEDLLENERICYLQTPVFMKSDVMHATCQLSDFEENLYTINEGKDSEPDHYLIATSEQPISGMFMNERLLSNELPKKFLGDSLCFRKEAGAHGKDNLGIFRIHQFQKIEMFYICNENDSERLHNEMVKNASDFLKSLNISYKNIIICSGAMNDAAVLKYDIEAYFPAKKEYRELNSISNCTDYQSRSLNIRLGVSKKEGKKEFVHMLNGTLCAVHRALCCLLENYQTIDGVIIPKVLRPYFYNKEFIKYSK